MDESTTEAHYFPPTLDRDFEERLVDLCATGDFDPERWRGMGPPFFMAGLAVLLAGIPGFDRPALLRLAEALHAGSTQIEIFSVWLKGSPVRPSRFLPMVSRRMHDALPEDLEVAYRGDDGAPRTLYFDRQYSDTLALMQKGAHEDSISRSANSAACRNKTAMTSRRSRGMG